MMVARFEASYVQPLVNSFSIFQFLGIVVNLTVNDLILLLKLEVNGTFTGTRLPLFMSYLIFLVFVA